MNAGKRRERRVCEGNAQNCNNVSFGQLSISHPHQTIRKILGIMYGTFRIISGHSFIHMTWPMGMAAISHTMGGRRFGMMYIFFLRAKCISAYLLPHSHRRTDIFCTHTHTHTTLTYTWPCLELNAEQFVFIIYSMIHLMIIYIYLLRTRYTESWFPKIHRHTEAQKSHRTQLSPQRWHNGCVSPLRPKSDMFCSVVDSMSFYAFIFGQAKECNWEQKRKKLWVINRNEMAVIYNLTWSVT